MKLIRFALVLATTAALTYALNTKLGDIPPLGKFLNPYSGFWTNAESTDFPDGTSFQLRTVDMNAQVFYDNDGVPHIFADSDKDLYFAQGYVTARDRLFQMELQTYLAGGRLSEILGPLTIELDRSHRRMGMVYGAERKLAKANEDPRVKEALEAYAAGVNMYINSLSPDEYPLEYKLLDFAPEEWTPIKTILLINYMSKMLTGSSSDVSMSNTLAYFGQEFVDKYILTEPPTTSTVMPTDYPWSFTGQDIPTPGDDFTPALTKNTLPFAPDPNNGSNNWAVHPSRTANGNTLVANDPHLGMTLPAIWYEVQLHGPDHNVYGASIPGAPFVIVGFTDETAWGVTTTYVDVMDWFEVRFRDDSMNEYFYNGEWKETRKRRENIVVRGGEDVSDLVTYTHHGPVMYAKGEEPFNKELPVGHALSWIGHYPTNDARTFYLLNRSKTYADYREAIHNLQSIPQNVVFGSREGDIALATNGLFPNKFEGQGMFIGDGSNPAYDWNTFIPMDHVPISHNPERGFVSSANQRSANPGYPYQLQGNYAAAERGRRINQRLGDMEKASVQDMMALQLDNYSFLAAEALPIMLEHLNTDGLDEQRSRAVALLKQWDYLKNKESVEATIFEAWWLGLYRRIWRDEIKSPNDLPLQFPRRDVTYGMMKNEPDAPWFDDTNTPETETMADLINTEFETAMAGLIEKYGPIGAKWRWGLYQKTRVGNIAQLPGLGRDDVVTGGSYETVNAISRQHGPSVRMIVELAEGKPNAYMVYPGGQSGNPGSPFYDNFVDVWARGEYRQPAFFKSKSEVESASTGYWLNMAGGTN